MRKNKIIKIATAITFTSILTLNSFNIYAADNISQYNSELQQIIKEQKANEAKLTGVEKEIARYTYEVAELDGQMEVYSKQLAALQVKVDTVNKKLKEYEDALQNSAQKYNSAQDLYATRLRAIYENGLPSVLEILLSSKGITDFFSRMNVYTSILEYDKSLVGNMQSQKEYVDYIKKDIEVQKLQLDQLKYDTQKSTDALNDALEAKQKKVASLETSKSELKATSKELTAKKEAARKKINDEIARIAREAEEAAKRGTGSSFTPTIGADSGEYAWPVPGYNIITTKFGTIYNLVNPAGSAHTGADIAGYLIFGKPIVAAQDGVVKVATYSNYGYGNYIILNHGTNSKDGKNYITLYGHASSLAVSVGEKVKKGQVIAYVGSTGNSTGPHLHFELRLNGALADPLALYPDMKFVYY